VLLVADIMVLYVIYLLNVRNDPSFSHFQEVPTSVIACLAITALFICIYLLCFLYTLFFTICNFCHIPWRSRILFMYSIFMLCICISTLFVGVYSPYYSNGGIFLFFFALFNLYVYSLIYLNWPSDILTPITLHE
jgi:Wnt-binding factor required for Wnt secretion